MALLNIHNVQASIGERAILRGVSLQLSAGETVALMGPNGSGKSTLASILMGHPDYVVTGGNITYAGADLLALAPEERARAGIFLAFQYPQAIAGVTFGNFLRVAYNATHTKQLSVPDFIALLKQKMDTLQLPHSFMQRAVNDGLSGGEKKRAEMLQLAVLEPRLAILDETDSGLDVDALTIVGHALQALRHEQPALAVVVITHHQRILQHLVPDRVAVMQAGKIVADGGTDILTQIDTSGFQKFEIE